MAATMLTDVRAATRTRVQVWIDRGQHRDGGGQLAFPVFNQLAGNLRTGLQLGIRTLPLRGRGPGQRREEGHGLGPQDQPDQQDEKSIAKSKHGNVFNGLGRS